MHFPLSRSGLVGELESLEYVKESSVMFLVHIAQRTLRERGDILPLNECPKDERISERRVSRNFVTGAISSISQPDTIKYPS